jgi:hypothetical protein
MCRPSSRARGVAWRAEHRPPPPDRPGVARDLGESAPARRARARHRRPQGPELGADAHHPGGHGRACRAVAAKVTAARPRVAGHPDRCRGPGLPADPIKNLTRQDRGDLEAIRARVDCVRARCLRGRAEQRRQEHPGGPAQHHTRSSHANEGRHPIPLLRICRGSAGSRSRSRRAFELEGSIVASTPGGRLAQPGGPSAVSALP